MANIKHNSMCSTHRRQLHIFIYFLHLIVPFRNIHPYPVTHYIPFLLKYFYFYFFYMTTPSVQ